MHDTAYLIGRGFFETYMPGGSSRILDVGAQNVNGSLRDVAPPNATYVGVDLATGRGVDIVLSDPHVLPFEDDAFDAVVSSSCFEHDAMFWLTFLEVVRVTRPSGYIYINAPSNGPYHQYPIDSWRFYPDAGIALATWAARSNRAVQLVESFVAPRLRNVFNDLVMIFSKDRDASPTGRRLADQVAGAFNIRRAGAAAVRNRIASWTEGAGRPSA